jgi:hypothetical protein
MPAARARRVNDARSDRSTLEVAGAQRRAWPTVSGLPSEDLSLPGESRVAVAGDWESLGPQVFSKLRRLKRLCPSLRTVLHLGDLRWEPPVRLGGHLVYRRNRFLPLLERTLEALDLRLLLTPGNHDDWAALSPAFQAHPNRPYRLSPRMWALPRGLRFIVGGRQFLSFGGAVSVHADRGLAEAPSDDEVARASLGGDVDVLLTHEPPNAGITSVDAVLARRSGWHPDLLERSAQSRRRIDGLVAAVHPLLSLHGHMHVAGRICDVNGRQTVALPDVTARGNIIVLELGSLEVRELDGLESDWERRWRPEQDRLDSCASAGR